MTRTVSKALFADFVDHFRDKSIKNEEVPIDYLRQKHKLSEADAQACLAVFKENVSDFGLIEEHLGRPVIVSRDVAIANLKSTTGESTSNLNGQSASQVGGSAFVGIHPTQSEQPAAATAGPAQAPRALDTASLPQFHFNIQIHLPESASAEVYDSIFRGISTHLLGRSGE